MHCQIKESLRDKFVPRVPQGWISSSRGDDGTIQPMVLASGAAGWLPMRGA